MTRITEAPEAVLLTGRERAPFADDDTQDWKQVRPVGFDIVLLAGQSNMVGFTGPGTTDSRIDWTHDRIFQWSPTGGNDNDPDYANRLLKASDPLLWMGLSNLPEWGDEWGPSAGMEFARRILPFTPPGRSIVLVPAAVGGTSLVNSAWNAGNGMLFAQAVEAVTAAIRALPNARLTHVLWVQGESDILNNAPAADYRAGLLATLQGFRTQIPNAEDAVILIGQMVPEWIGPNPATLGRQVDAVHREMPLLLDDVSFIQGPVDSHTESTTIHYDARGQRELGRRFARRATSAAVLTGGLVLGTPEDVTVLGATLRWRVPDTDASHYAIEHRAAGSTDPWTRIVHSLPQWVEPGQTASYTFTNLSQDIEIRVAGMHNGRISAFSAPVTMSWLTMPDPFVRLDFANAATAPLTVPSVGTDTTEWTSKPGDEPVVVDLNQGRALRFTAAQVLETAATLPAGPFSALLLVKNTSLDGQGVYFTARSSPLPYMLWRGQPGGATLNAGTNGNGSRASGGEIVPDVWRAYAVTFNPELPSNHLKIFIDGAFVAEADAPVWDPGGIAGMLVNSIYSDQGTGDGNDMILAAFEVWTGALPAPLVAQRTTLVAAEAGVTLGQA